MRSGLHDGCGPDVPEHGTLPLSSGARTPELLIMHERSLLAAAPPASEEGIALEQPTDATCPTRAARTARQTASGIVMSVVMPTMSWTGAFESCARQVLDGLDRRRVPCELIVAYDGTMSERPAWLQRPDVIVTTTGRRSGPAAARNRAAELARGAILLFVDADVMLAEGAIDRVHAAFEDNPDLVGIFGTYDDEPAAPGVVSRFRNLLHHHTHVTHPGRASTFWAGCGALRASTFLDAGGFDVRFDRPSVEDIELGMRVAAAGGRIELDPGLRCKHLKRWTLRSMMLTDVFSRAVPWTRLLFEAGDLPATLNIDWRSRASGVCVMVMAASLPLAPWFAGGAIVAAVCLIAVIALNAGFYRLCLRKGGIAFTSGAIALHLLYYLYATLTFGVLAVGHRVVRRAERPRTATPTS
jgi:hypothetical protein